ncbi:MAG: hypothetical protein WBP72_09965 [Rhodocyclaceae bacterium]
MKYPHFVEQHHGNPAAFPLADVGAQLLEQSLDVFPLDVCAGRARENEIKGSLMFPLHA